MLSATRVVVIDDEQEHLANLTDGLNRQGTACLPIHFTGEPASMPPCPHVRVIFADLHLIAGSSTTNHTQNFTTIGSLIESNIKPSGPYFIVLWTRYPEQADELYRFLQNRLQGSTKPFAVKPLDKNDHLRADNSVKNIEKLHESITTIVNEQPQVGALLNWENRVLDAAADTISSIVKLVALTPDRLNLNEEVGRLLASLAVKAVGEEHVEKDRFRAVNETLLPILADRIAVMRTREADNKLWQAAFPVGTNPELLLDEASKLNNLLHIAPPAVESHGAERGAVIVLPEGFSGDAFERTIWPCARNSSRAAVRM